MLILEPRPSMRARALVVAMYLLAFSGLVAWVPGPLAVILGLVGATGFALEWRNTRPPAVLECRTAGEWWIERDGPWNLHSTSVLTPWLVLLVLDNRARRIRLPLLPDSLPAPQWRRLRATLRQHGGEAPGT